MSGMCVFILTRRGAQVAPALFKEDRLTTADSSQRSRRIGHLSRVFPPRDVLSSLQERAARGEGIGLVINSSQRSAFILRIVEVKTKMNTNRKSLL